MTRGRRLGLGAALAFALLSPAVSARPGPALELDRSFGDGGVATVADFGSPGTVVALPDGGALFGGTVAPTTSLDSPPEQALLRRVDATGALDPGTFPTPAAWSAYPRGAISVIVTDARKRFWVFAILYGTNPGKLSVARYLSDGQLDPAFGTNGVEDFPVANVNAASAVSTRDGLVVALGGPGRPEDPGYFQLVRLREDGSLDPAFGSTVNRPLPRFSLEQPPVIRADPQGRLLLAGQRSRLPRNVYSDYFYADWMIARFDSTGRLDRTFGRRGIITERTKPFTSGAVTGLSLRPGGRLLAIGSVDGKTRIIRYDERGRPDPTFGRQGRRTYGRPFIEVITATRCGGFLTATRRQSGRSPDVIFTRYRPDGTRDPAFGSRGRLVVRLPEDVDSLRAIATDSAGRLVAAMGMLAALERMRPVVVRFTQRPLACRPARR